MPGFHKPHLIVIDKFLHFLRKRGSDQRQQFLQDRQCVGIYRKHRRSALTADFCRHTLICFAQLSEIRAVYAVAMRMGINKTRRKDESVRIDHKVGCVLCRIKNDFSVHYADAAFLCCSSGPVNDIRVFDEEFHAFFLSLVSERFLFRSSASIS